MMILQHCITFDAKFRCSEEQAQSAQRNKQKAFIGIIKVVRTGKEICIGHFAS